VNGDGHEHPRELLGSYLLGGLPESDAGRVRAHLDACPSCRGELAVLTPVAHALSEVGEVGPSGLPPQSGPPPSLLDRIERQVRDEAHDRRRARTLRAGLAALAAAAAVIAIGAGGVFLGGSLAPAAPAVPLEAVAVEELVPRTQADADLVAHSWGVEVKLVATGLEDGGAYRLEVLGRNGDRFPAGAFLGTGDKPLRCNLNAAVLREDAASFQVRDAAGQVVLRADL